MMDTDDRLGRLREPRFLLGYISGGALAWLVAFGLYEYSQGAWAVAAGAVALGGLALSAQLAKGTWRTAPRRAALVVASGVLVGAALGYAMPRLARWDAAQNSALTGTAPGVPHASRHP